jgi:O-methyltransferase
MLPFEEVWRVIGPRSILGRRKAHNLYTLLQQVEDLPGGVAEVGVFRGSTARMLRMLLPEADLHLYDTFQGIVQADLSPQAHQNGEFAVSLEEVKRMVGEEGPLLHYHVGTFPHTFYGVPLRFVHSDTDTYSGTMATLKHMIPYLFGGGILVVDDYGWHQCPGVTQAVDQFLAGPHRQLGYQQDQYQMFLKMA